MKDTYLSCAVARYVEATKFYLLHVRRVAKLALHHNTTTPTAAQDHDDLYDSEPTKRGGVLRHLPTAASRPPDGGCA